MLMIGFVKTCFLIKAIDTFKVKNCKVRFIHDKEQYYFDSCGI